MSVPFVADLIYDVGLHRGEDSEFYLSKGFRVVAVEAIPALAQAAETRLRKYVNSGQLTILNVAVARRNGPMSFYVNSDNSVWGTAHLEWALRNLRLGTKSLETTVQGVDFADILREHGVPYYLKIDIEGSDMLCLEALRSFEIKPKYVSLESAKTSWHNLRREFDLFTALGYSKFKVIGQHIADKQTCPFPPKEGRYVDHRFEAGASGLFGDEAPGEWMTETEAIRAYRSIFLRYKLFGDDGVFHRSALTRRALRRFEPMVGWYDTHAAA